MEPQEYQTLFQLEETYWWYVARRRLVRDMLEDACGHRKDRLLLDIGCGTGANATVLSQFGTVLLLDASQAALNCCQARGLKNVMASNGEHIGLRSESLDVVTALDVLEHVDRDVDSMREILRVLKPGGMLLITVPAFGFLWSEHDEALHHRRRYTMGEMRNKLAASGFETVRATYFITSLFAPIVVMRVWQGIFKKNVQPKTSHVILPGWINRLIEGILEIERHICRRMNLPFGVSIVTVARKPLTHTAQISEHALAASSTKV
ncbi:MAG TPA: class I SAM-dependent methyltransferase [Bryobacteraceae bacterium]|nr:class I SAM-dependent methyltransferase [Bryobacteraceae bacterium]